MTKVSFSNPPATHKDWQIEPGCYVDSARGIYAIDRIIEIAEGYGFQVNDDDPANPLPESLADYEFAGELEDEADDYLNTRFAIEGYFWGRNENGDWGLWEVEEN